MEMTSHMNDQAERGEMVRAAANRTQPRGDPLRVAGRRWTILRTASNISPARVRLSVKEHYVSSELVRLNRRFDR